MTPDELVGWLASHHHTTVDAVLSPSRMRRDIDARQQACWVLHRAGWSYSAIGRLLDRDHTTVMHAVSKIDPAPGWLAALADDVDTQQACGRCGKGLGLRDTGPECRRCLSDRLEVARELAELMDVETLRAVQAMVAEWGVPPGRLMREAVASWGRRRVHLTLVGRAS